MFQFPGFAPISRWHAFRMPGSPIRTPADLRPFAPPRGLSQLVTSFFASESQGIPRTPFLDFLVSSFNCKRFIRLILGFFLFQVRSILFRISLFPYVLFRQHVKGLAPGSPGSCGGNGGPPRAPPPRERGSEDETAKTRLGHFFCRSDSL